MSYNCCTRTDSDYTTLWHNSLLFNGTDQLGDNRNSTGQDTSSRAPWFFSRDAAMPLHASTANYSFARGNGTHLYPPSLGISSLLHTTVLSREANYVILQDVARLHPLIQPPSYGWSDLRFEDDLLRDIRDWTLAPPALDDAGQQKKALL